MYWKDLDISIQIQEDGDGTARIMIQMSDRSNPPIAFGVLDQLERLLHEEVSEAILGQSRETAVVVKPFQRGLRGNYVACYNKLSGEPKR